MNAAQFAEYTEELREFSVSHGVRCGAPKDLWGLVEALEAGGIFFEECSSMLRSVVYRERGEADAVSLLMLVTHAWGGLTEPEEGTALAKPVLRLWEFVRGAMRAPQLREADAPAEDVCVAVARVEAVAEQCTAAAQQTLFEVESALRELEGRSAEVRLYRELLEQREARLQELVAAELPVRAEEEAVEIVVAREFDPFDPWDENSELQQELRRFAEHRERVAVREAERAMRPLYAKLLEGAEGAVVRLLGRGEPVRRGLGH